MLPSRCLVEVAAHLGKPGAHLVLQLVEPGGGLHTEAVDRGTVRVDFHPEVSDVTIAGGRKVAGRVGDYQSRAGIVAERRLAV